MLTGIWSLICVVGAGITTTLGYYGVAVSFGLAFFSTEFYVLGQKMKRM